jgi:hypothetical protein
MTVVYEHERRSNCIRTEGTLEGLRWCESDLYSREELGFLYYSKEELGFLYKDLFILGLGWPSHLISSGHTPIEMLSEIANSRGKEEMPPVGENQALNDPQVRWCVFEKARLEMMKSWTMTDQEVAELKEAAELKMYVARAGAFNTYATRHNKRCNRFQYQQGILAIIERELLFEGKRLQSEGAQRIYSSKSSLKATVK